MYFVLNCFGFNGISCKCHCCWHRIIDRNKKNFFPNKNNLISTFFFTSLLNSVELLVVAPECLSLFHPLQGARVVHHGESTGLPPSGNIQIQCIWVDFVVVSLPCSEGFFSRHSSFPLSRKTTTSKFRISVQSGAHIYTSFWESLSA